MPLIKQLVDTYAGKILLEKNLVTLYEAIQEFWVAELEGRVVGCGALHVLWADLGEIRTVAVHPSMTGRGIGHAIVDQLLRTARDLRLQRLFVLTFETEFFARHGFTEIEGTPVTAEVFEEMKPLLRHRCRRIPGPQLRQAEHLGQLADAAGALTRRVNKWALNPLSSSPAPPRASAPAWSSYNLERSSFVTGEILHVDGGQSAGR